MCLLNKGRRNFDLMINFFKTKSRGKKNSGRIIGRVPKYFTETPKICIL